jgi:copper chaperone
MKKILIMFSALTVLTIFSMSNRIASHAFAQAVTTDSTLAKPQESAILIHVTGMMCHSCESSVVTALSKVKGVSDVHADYSAGTVSLHSVGKVEDKKLIAAVKDAGFSASVDHDANVPKDLSK